MAVAVSGGRDSTALLHCTLRQALPLGVRVVALHVHHGLQPQAEAWMDHVRRQARRWGADFHGQRLAEAPAAGESVEAWARRHRYAALAGMARAAGCGVVLLAHHRRDQAETVLLQALRGGGAAGLSAMPVQIERDGIVWARPWLAQPREAIEAYVRRHRLRFVDDDSNADLRPARNRLRLRVWPALQAAFPDAEQALSLTAQRAQDAAAILAAVVDADLRHCARPGAGLDAVACLALTPPRRRELLRAWLQVVMPVPVPETLVRRLADELAARRAEAAPRLRAGARWPAGPGELRLHRGLLQWYRGAPAAAPAPAPAPAQGPLTLDLSRPGRHAVPAWGGCWVVTRVRQGGLAVDRLRTACLRPRQGGERFQSAAGSLPRSLKKQYQAAGVPAWSRQAPLLWAGDGALLFVPGLGVDARQLAPAGSAQMAVRWACDAPQPAPAL
jgi:tRNA(Ile)-lysidine synthase